MTTHSHHHAHTHSPLLLPFALTLLFAFVECIGGWFTGSLALLGDAGHMFSDSAALGLAWLASWVAKRPSSARHNYGYLRAEVLVAMLNACAMLLVVVGIVLEAWQRLQAPQPIKVSEMMLIALLGLLINIFVAWYLHRDTGHQHSINHRAAFLHVLGDLLGSLAALLSGAVIYFTGWLAIDALLSLLIVALISISSVRLMREALHVLMEGVPLHLQHQHILTALQQQTSVQGVHALRVWAISSEHIALTAHIVVKDMLEWATLLPSLHQMLRERFGIHDAVLQPELVSEQHTNHCSLHHS
jgi:cobalt-zinc-cadmium efflux system protein